MEDAARESRAATVRACAAYGAIMGASGFNQPFFPIWLAAHQMTNFQISVVLSLPLLLRVVVAPALGAFADRLGSRNRLIQVMSILILLIALALGWSHGFWMILILASAMTVLSQSMSPLVDANVIALVRRGVVRHYGRVRLWGSAGFAVTTMIGGFVLGVGGPQAVFVAFLASLGAQVVIFQALPSAPVAPMRREVAHLGERPLVLGVFVIVALILSSHTTFNTFGSIYLRDIGYSEWSVGLLWALATSAEIAMFWAGPHVLARLGPFGLLHLAAGAALLRWTLMAAEPSLALMIVLQMLHAATFSGSYLALMRFIETRVPDRNGAAAQGIFVSILGVMTAAATLTVGPTYTRYGGGAFIGAAVLPALALIGLAFARRSATASAVPLVAPGP